MTITIYFGMNESGMTVLGDSELDYSDSYVDYSDTDSDSVDYMDLATPVLPIKYRTKYNDKCCNLRYTKTLRSFVFDDIPNTVKLIFNIFDYVSDAARNTCLDIYKRCVNDTTLNTDKALLCVTSLFIAYKYEDSEILYIQDDRRNEVLELEIRILKKIDFEIFDR